jgi:hypothetical protein
MLYPRTWASFWKVAGSVAGRHRSSAATAMALLCVSVCASGITSAQPGVKTEKQPTRATHGAWCTTPWGAKIADGKTAQGFCINSQRSAAVCGLTKLCKNGQWVPK